MSKRQLDDWLASFLDYTENTEPPFSFRLWTGLVCISAVLKRKCMLPWGSLVFYPNLYVVLVGPSGKARKGTAMGPGQKLLRELGIKMTAEATTRESLIRELATATESVVDPKTGSMTMHSSLLIFSKELTVFLGYQNHQLMSDLTDWFDCDDRWTYRTKTQGTDIIEGLYVSLFGATTPALIQSALPPDAIGGGLTSRIIFVYEPRKGKSVAVPMVTARELELQRCLLHDLEQILMLQGEFHPTAEFLDLWIPWYNNLEKNQPFDDARLAGYLERRAMHLLKLCVIVSAAKSNDMLITPPDFKQALNILESTEKKMPFTFAGVGRSGHADIMNDILMDITLNKTVPYEDLLARFYNDADKRMFDMMLHTLTATGSIRVDYNGSDKTIVFVDKVK